MSNETPKVAIVHDVLHRYGGAERVVEQIAKIWPDADIYTSRYISHPETSEIASKKIHTTFMQQLPWFNMLAKLYTPFFPFAFESLDLRAYDIIITSTAHFAKGVLTNPDQLHICYCHTPPRFLYQYSSESKSRKSGILSPIVTALDHRLRMYDYAIAQRPDIVVTNSHTTAQRIKTFYQRDPEVIYPPIPIEQLIPQSPIPKDDYYLVVSRLVAYKNIDLIIRSFRYRKERLIIVGDGPQREYLQGMASKNVEFVGFVDRSKQIDYYQKAKALILATEDEDFGITPVESIAAGTPVIAYRSGGITETVKDKETGILYDSLTTEAINTAIDEFQSRSVIQDPTTISMSVSQYSEATFREKLRNLVVENWEKSTNTINNR
ncbi:glycosyltransferase family 4 protein [candidate division WWE3 bacterium]|nr:glycosyltransferase family 4 protein [candidate division WWE3 bacterium]